MREPGVGESDQKVYGVTLFILGRGGGSHPCAPEGCQLRILLLSLNMWFCLEGT